eukprot:5133926-Karenia_brevis.AAC.1
MAMEQRIRVLESKSRSLNVDQLHASQKATEEKVQEMSARVAKTAFQNQTWIIGNLGWDCEPEILEARAKQIF